MPQRQAPIRIDAGPVLRSACGHLLNKHSYQSHCHRPSPHARLRLPLLRRTAINSCGRQGARAPREVAPPSELRVGVRRTRLHARARTAPRTLEPRRCVAHVGPHEHGLRVVAVLRPENQRSAGRSSAVAERVRAPARPLPSDLLIDRLPRLFRALCSPVEPPGEP